MNLRGLLKVESDMDQAYEQLLLQQEREIQA